MKLGSLGGVRIWCSPLLPVLTLAYILSGKWTTVSLTLLALALHEAAHTLVARGLGYRVATVELQPFGFVARLSGRMDRWDELCVSAAGPLFSLTAALVCAAMDRADTGGAMGIFGDANMALGCLNLLPAAPLDGGRVLRGWLPAVSERAEKLAAWISVTIAVCLCAAGTALLLKGNVTLLIFGLFLLLAAIRELRAGSVPIQSILRREKRMRSGRVLPIACAAVDAGMRAGEAARHISRERYTVWIVVGENMRTLGYLDEGRVLEGIARAGMDARMGDLVDPGG